MTEQEDKTVTTASQPGETAPAATPAAPAAKPTPKKPVPKAEASSNSRKKPVAKAKPKTAGNVPDLNSKAYPLHPERIWPD